MSSWRKLRHLRSLLHLLSFLCYLRWEHGALGNVVPQSFIELPSKLAEVLSVSHVTGTWRSHSGPRHGLHFRGWILLSSGVQVQVAIASTFSDADANKDGVISKKAGTRAPTLVHR